MSDPEDVCEYVDGPVKESKFHVRVLVAWLESIRGCRSPRRVTTVCCSGLLQVKLVLSSHDLRYRPSIYVFRYAVTQVPEIRPLLSKGLEALSVQETGQLLSYLGLQSLVSDFLRSCVSNVPLVCLPRQGICVPARICLFADQWCGSAGHEHRRRPP